MLASSGDLTRLVTCATDQARHDRMRDLTGHDALAFLEISITKQFVLAQPAPDLTCVTLLAVQREYLTDRSTGISTGLPAVWAMLGQHARAEARELVETSREISPVPEHAPSGSPLTSRVRRYLAQAIVIGAWTQMAASLAHVDLLAVRALADELQVRWGLDGSSPR